MNLLLLEPHELDAAGDVTLRDARATHLLDVLKVSPARGVRIGRLDGPYGTGVVTAAAGRTVTLRCAFEADPPPRPSVDLLLALPRPKVMRRLWAQLAALGVGRIVLTNAARVERHYFDTHLLQESTYRPLLIEGLQQARDTRVPLVSIHRRFKVLVEDDLDALCAEGARLVADPSAGGRIDRAFSPPHTGRVLIAVGPEGGWSAFETSLLVAHGFQPVGMGPRTLRSDTAAVALLALVHHAIGGCADPTTPPDAVSARS